VARTDRLRHLFHLRQIEEESQASDLERAVAELRRLEEALKLTRLREAAGRSLIEESIRTGKTQDRLSGLAEVDSAARIRSVVIRRKCQAEENLERIRQQYFAKRMRTRQAETLLRSAAEHEAHEQQRRSQSALDEWHRMLQRRQTGHRTDIQSYEERET
jgi:hypothetical protein